MMRRMGSQITKRRHRTAFGAIAVATVLLLGLPGPRSLQAASLTPPTVVSTNLCADLLALSLTSPEQLLSVSWKSQDPTRSSMAAEAAKYHANASDAEEIIALKPDIVLASRAWRRHPQAANFEALGIRIVVVPLARTWPDILSVTQWVAEKLGREERGRTLVKETQRRLDKLEASAKAKSQRSVLYLRPSGGSAGAGSYIDTLLTGAGLGNHATKLGLEGWGRLDLEQLLLSPPDLFLLSDYTRDRGHAEGQLLRHPAMRAILADRPVLRLPSNQGSCATWHLINTAEFLAGQLASPLMAQDVGT